jgi:hypothetical protein
MYTTNEVNLKFNYILNQVELMYISHGMNLLYITLLFVAYKFRAKVHAH